MCQIRHTLPMIDKSPNVTRFFSIFSGDIAINIVPRVISVIMLPVAIVLM